MARLVLGTDKSVRIPAIVVEKPTPMPLSIQKAKDANGKIVGGSTIIDIDGATDVNNYVLAYAYYQANNIIGTVDLSSLTTISGNYGCSYMFFSCTGITNVDLSSLTTISGNSGCSYMFHSCYGITSVNLSSLTTVSGGSGCSYMFNGCTGITNIDLSSLTTISSQNGCAYMFQSCTGITSVNLNSLNQISGSRCLTQMFRGCTSLTTLSFPALTSTSFGSNTNQFYQMLLGVTGCTVHFPSNLQAIIGSWSDVTAGFDGTSTTVLFDLPATN